MAAYVRQGCYSVERTGLSVSFDTSIDPAVYAAVNLDSQSKYNPSFNPNGYERQNFCGNLQLIRVRGTIDGGSADNITLKGYADVEGTRLVIEPTEAVCIPDVSGGQHSAVFLVDAWWTAEVDTIYFWITTQNHTFVLSEIEVTWTE